MQAENTLLQGIVRSMMMRGDGADAFPQ